ncbi:MAG: isopentenyl transferase family protein [Planctomycetota bacterium]
MLDKSESIPVAVVGPTCSGKTQIVNELAMRLPLSVINLDSFQIYDHFRLGTGRADLAEGIRSYLYGVQDPRQTILPEEYVAAALDAQTEIQRSGRIPLYEGGSVSFLRALLPRQPLRLFGLYPDTADEARLRIERRVLGGDESALIDEIQSALALGFRETLVLRDDVVYLPYLDYVEGRVSLEAARERAIANLTKRHVAQLTDYRDFEITWLRAGEAMLRLTDELR